MVDINIMPIVPKSTAISNGTPIQRISNILRSEDTFGTTMLVLCIDAFGFDKENKQPNVFNWHPDTILQEIKDEWGVIPIKSAFDKLMAAICVVTTDLFFKNVSRFIPLANVLAGDDFSPGTFDIADSLECAWAITEALILHPPVYETELFSDEVRHYLTKVLLEEGYVKPPDILRIAIDANFSNKVRYNFSDDPVLFSGIFKAQEDKTNEVEDTIKQNLMELADQLKALPLKTGNVNDVVKRIGELFKKVDGEKHAQVQEITFEKIANLFEVKDYET